MLPSSYDWLALSAAERTALLRRPETTARFDLEQKVAVIIAQVRTQGDSALAHYTRRFDNVELTSLAVSESEFEAAEALLSENVKAAIGRAIDNVRSFHQAQAHAPIVVEIAPGVRCEHREVPIAAVGLYVPAGSAPLPSTAIMLAIPAVIAGCPKRVLCTPPRKDGTADPAVLDAARRCGITQVYKVGGAQAIAAMAYGTESIPKVDKVFGPGNAWVTAAKIQVAQDPNGAALDLPAGPSEVLIIADEGANPTFVAADLLAQAEHDADSQVVLVTTSRALAAKVAVEVDRQKATMRRHMIIAESLACSRIILVPDLSTAIAVSNVYAPEHLILAVRDPHVILADVRSAGTVFLGDYSPETIGDYCSGANHVLPTNGYAHSYSGLSLHDFLRRVCIQELSPVGLRDLGQVAITLAGIEGLDAHANAVKVRVAALAAQ